ncbi:MAG: hypothetical protein IJ070_00465, partial [Firmicutes bacterium]|nr:hypothetical protein [Bacillota bacterium]
QLKELVSLNRYYEAAAITDEINWNKVRNIGTLTMVGKVYEHLKRYEDARDVFTLAYDRSPVSRTVLLHLTKLSIKRGNVDDAERYYEEFVECAPRDRVRYELAYEIATLRNASVEERIHILEQFKAKEYTEEWALELAKLYHEAGMEKECVSTCDELFIWFGEGDYVRQALELKASVTPLSDLQQEKLPLLQEQSRLQWEEEQRRREEERQEAERRELERLEKERLEKLRREEEARLAAEEGREVGDRDVDRAFPEGSVKWNDEKLRSKESVGDYDGSLNAGEVVGSAVGKFKNLFKNMSKMQNRAEDEYLEEEEDAFLEDLEAASKQSVGEAVVTAPAATEEPIPVTEAKPVEEAILEQALSEVDMTPEKPVEQEEGKKTTLIERLTARLQISDEPDEGDYDEDDTVEEALDEWDQTKKKINKTIDRVAKTENLDERRAQAAQEMNDIMARLAQLQAILQPEGTAEASASAAPAAVAAEEPAVAPQTAGRVSAAQSPVAESYKEATAEEVSEAKRGVEEAARKAREQFEKAAAEEAAAKAAEAEMAAPVAEEPEVKAVEEPAAPVEEASADAELDSAYFSAPVEEAPAAEETPAVETPVVEEAPVEEEILPTEEILPEEEIMPEEEPVVAEEAKEEAVPVEEVVPEVTDAAEEPIEEKIVLDEAEEAETAEEKIVLDEEVSEEPADPAEGTPLEAEPDDYRPLTEDQKEMFSYFVSVPGLARQISKALEGASGKTKGAVASTAGNVIIQGPAGIGKTVLATNLIKAIQVENDKEKSRIGKISAQSLNKRDFATLLEKITGGYLIVEKAGNLSEETVTRMAEVMESETGGLVVVLEDTEEGIANILAMNESFAEKFTEVITVPEFSVDDLVEFGKSYAYEMECVIEEMGVLALHTRIQNIQKIDHATMLAEVKEIVDGAIEHAENHNKRRFGRHAKRYTDDDYLILREEDFSA